MQLSPQVLKSNCGANIYTEIEIHLDIVPNVNTRSPRAQFSSADPWHLERRLSCLEPR
jgi:hypothetical protein